MKKTLKKQNKSNNYGKETKFGNSMSDACACIFDTNHSDVFSMGSEIRDGEGEGY